MSSMLFKDITVLNEYGQVFEHAYVGVDGNSIDYFDTVAPEKAYGETYDGAGKMLTPGMYNAHAHSPMSLLRGRGENLPLDRWLNESIFPFEAHITDEDAYNGTMLSIAEMLRFGVVSFSDMYYNTPGRFKALMETGIKGNLDYTTVSFDQSKSYAEVKEYELNKRYFDEMYGANNGRILYDACLHAEYTTYPAIVQGLSDWAVEAGVRMQVHVSETESEVQGCIERHGMTPVAYLEKNGLFRVPTTAAHCVHLAEEDYEILARNKVFVATNPASNAKLGSGIADVEGMLKDGITVCLGTDSVASNNNLNMHKDMYLLALMQRAQKQEAVGISSQDIITIATLNGALSQGRTDCGSIQVGKKADLVVYDIDTPWMQPIESLASNFIYSAQGSDCVLTMVDGDVLYKNGEYMTLDIERVLHDTKQSRLDILAKM